MNTESVSEIQKAEIDEAFKQLLKMDIMNDWLETYEIKSRPQKKHNLEMFLGWLGKSPEQVLELRKNDQNRGLEKLCIKWVNFLIEKQEYEVSTSVNKLGTVRSFFHICF